MRLPCKNVLARGLILRQHTPRMKKLPLILLVCAALGAPIFAEGAKKNVLMISGRPSHGPGEHEHNAGIQLLAKCLAQGAADRVDVKVHLNAEWPTAEEFAKADTVVIYSDGGGGHPALKDDHLDQLGREMKRGCGFVCLHYAVEPTIPKGNTEFINWLGGAFEINWSVNPHWDGDFKSLPKHAISSGVQPFTTNDEWYFHMRFREGMKGVTPILSSIAPDSTMGRGDGTHSGNPAVREDVKNKVPQHVSWAVEREDGGRGFGFTGGHYHKGWGNENQRRLVLNAIVWRAKGEVPDGGIASKITDEELAANLDPKQPRKPAPPKPIEAAK